MSRLFGPDSTRVPHASLTLSMVIGEPGVILQPGHITWTGEPCHPFPARCRCELGAFGPQGGVQRRQALFTRRRPEIMREADRVFVRVDFNRLLFRVRTVGKAGKAT